MSVFIRHILLYFLFYLQICHNIWKLIQIKTSYTNYYRFPYKLNLFMGCGNSSSTATSKHFKASRMFQKYTIDKVIGSGSFAKIRLAHETRLAKNKVAIKYLPKQNITRRLELVKDEVRILQKLDHPNIVRYYEMYEDKKYIYLVMEYCQGGELFDLIAEQKTPFKEAAIRPVIRQLLMGINHCHAHEIAHRDIKPENIMLISEYEEESPNLLDSEIKFIDFGLSKEWKMGHELNTTVGTCYYTAPEVMDGFYTPACDLWSIGVIFYVLLSLHLPFAGENIPQVVNNIKHQRQPSFENELWKSVSQQAKDLICKMLKKDPEARISANDALYDEWLIQPDSDSEAEFPNNSLWPSMPPKNRAMSVSIYNKLLQYNPKTAFQREAMAAICRRMSTDRHIRLTTAFTNIDKDNTGFIYRGDLVAAVEGAGIQISETDIDQIMLKVDYKGNNMINYTEFLAATIELQDILTDDKLLDLFKYFDSDSQGYITEDNIREVMVQAGRPISDEKLRAMMKEHDSITKDGKIDFNEFTLMMQQFNVENKFQLTTTIRKLSAMNKDEESIHN